MPTITAAARQQIRHAAAAAGATGMALRVAAREDEASGEIHDGVGFDERRE